MKDCRLKADRALEEEGCSDCILLPPHDNDQKVSNTVTGGVRREVNESELSQAIQSFRIQSPSKARLGPTWGRMTGGAEENGHEPMVR